MPIRSCIAGALPLGVGHPQFCGRNTASNMECPYLGTRSDTIGGALPLNEDSFPKKEVAPNGVPVPCPPLGLAVCDV